MSDNRMVLDIEAKPDGITLAGDWLEFKSTSGAGKHILLAGAPHRDEMTSRQVASYIAMQERLNDVLLATAESFADARAKVLVFDSCLQACKFPEFEVTKKPRKDWWNTQARGRWNK